MSVSPRGLCPSCPCDLLLENAVDRVAFVFGVSTGNCVIRGWVNSGGKYNKANAMAIYIVLHTVFVRFISLTSVLRGVKCGQIPKSQRGVP